MSDWIIIPKQHLKKIAKLLPEAAELLQKLEIKYDPYHGKERKVLIVSSHFHEKMEFCVANGSMDLNLTILLQHYIDKLYPKMSEADRERFKWILYGEVVSKMGLILNANARHAVERIAMRDELPVSNSLDFGEAEIIMSLFVDAQVKAMDMGLNAIQLFLEGKLDRLMPGDPRLDDYNRLSENKKKQLRKNYIDINGWEAFYNEDTAPSQTGQTESKQIDLPIMKKSGSSGFVMGKN